MSFFFFFFPAEVHFLHFPVSRRYERRLWEAYAKLHHIIIIIHDMSLSIIVIAFGETIGLFCACFLVCVFIFISSSSSKTDTKSVSHCEVVWSFLVLNG